MKIFPQNQVVAVQRRVELWKLGQHADQRLQHEGQQRHTDAVLGVDLAELVAQYLEIGYIGLVELGDVRNHHPVARKIGFRNTADARERQSFNFAESGEV